MAGYNIPTGRRDKRNTSDSTGTAGRSNNTGLAYGESTDANSSLLGRSIYPPYVGADSGVLGVPNPTIVMLSWISVVVNAERYSLLYLVIIIIIIII